MGGSGSNPSRQKDLLSASPFRHEERPTRERRLVLIIEDNESDVFLIQRALEATKLPLAFHSVRDGAEAVRFFDQTDGDPGKACPEVVILDINLPKKQGSDVLKHMRGSSRCARARVVAVSTSDSTHDREQMAHLGVDGYFCKPSDFDEFMKLGDLIKGLLTRDGS